MRPVGVAFCWLLMKCSSVCFVALDGGLACAPSGESIPTSFLSSLYSLSLYQPSLTMPLHTRNNELLPMSTV